jgi:hypothetical protein
MNKRVGKIEEFVVEKLTEEELPSLRYVLCVSGFIKENNEQSFKHQWKHLACSKEQHTLRWESKVNISPL